MRASAKGRLVPGCCWDWGFEFDGGGGGLCVSDQSVDAWKKPGEVTGSLWLRECCVRVLGAACCGSAAWDCGCGWVCGRWNTRGAGAEEAGWSGAGGSWGRFGCEDAAVGCR
jgi:hypothetical protein